MRLTKRQLRRIIREEYSRLKRQGLIRETFDEPYASHAKKSGVPPQVGSLDHFQQLVQNRKDDQAEELLSQLAAAPGVEYPDPMLEDYLWRLAYDSRGSTGELSQVWDDYVAGLPID